MVCKLKKTSQFLIFFVQVVNYVVEKMVLDKPIDSLSGDGTFGAGSVDGSFRSGLKPWKLKPSIEILCNNQATS